MICCIFSTLIEVKAVHSLMNRAMAGHMHGSALLAMSHKFSENTFVLTAGKKHACVNSPVA